MIINKYDGQDNGYPKSDIDSGKSMRSTSRLASRLTSGLVSRMTRVNFQPMLVPRAVSMIRSPILTKLPVRMMHTAAKLTVRSDAMVGLATGACILAGIYTGYTGKFSEFGDPGDSIEPGRNGIYASPRAWMMANEYPALPSGVIDKVRIQDGTVLELKRHVMHSCLRGYKENATLADAMVVDHNNQSEALVVTCDNFLTGEQVRRLLESIDTIPLYRSDDTSSSSVWRNIGDWLGISRFTTSTMSMFDVGRPGLLNERCRDFFAPAGGKIKKYMAKNSSKLGTVIHFDQSQYTMIIYPQAPEWW
jgi:hypothetical protein